MARKHLLLAILGLILISGFAAAEDEAEETGTDTVDEDIGKSRDGSRTDDEAVQREEEAIKLDGLSVAEVKEMRDKAEKHQFQAEVDRMMKLIINSLYKNKEIFLRELISNASDALDKIRFLSLTDKDALAATDELSIKIKADKDNHVLHITDTGIGMTKDDLIKNLGTIAKSGTSEFLNKVGEEDGGADMQDLIGQFGVGFYSSFLVADRVVVTSKHNDDDQHIWESDASTFSISKDPRGNTLGRGTQISLHMKEEAHDFLEQNSVKDLVQKYSQFINFNIFLWDSKTVKEEEPADEEEDAPEEKKEEDADAEASEDEDAAVEDEAEDDKPKTKTVEKTVWDWILVNDNKPIWTRKQSEIEDDEYIEFYKSFTKDTTDPMARTHFTAEGEVTFKSILFIPKSGPSDQFQNYGKKTDMVKMYVRRVFITDNFEDMMPKYLSFVKGVVDSDDLPLNVSRETLQQHKLLKVIKKKLVRKTLDMIKKIDPELYLEFWKEYSTNIKLGVIEDHSNRTRLAKLLRFFSSNSDTEATSLADYIERMKDKQEHIYFMAGTSREEVTTTPFVERLLKKGYEVLYLTEPVDEYCIQSLPEFEGKKFQNVAKEGVKLDESDKAKEHKEALEKEYEPLTTWLKEKALNDQIEKAVVSERLVKSPSALVASAYGWSGNMERIMRSQAYQKSNDASQNYYGGQKKTLEINPRHPLIKELRRRVDTNPDEQTTRDLAVVLYETATLRSSYLLKDTAGFAERIERMLRLSMDVSLTEEIEEEPEYEGEAEPEEEVDADEDEDAEADDGDEPAADDTTAEQTEGEGDQETCPTCMRHLLSIPDTDGDGTPDHLDNDDDGDGIPDIQEKEEIIEEKDDNDDDDGEGLISRLVTSLKNMAFIEDEEEDEDHDDDDEIDVIDLFKSWMFGDDDDDNDKDDKSNSGNAAERETTGHSYKATKRKLLSVEAFKHEKAPKPVKISDIISNIYDKLFHLVFPEKQSGLTKSTSRSNPKGAADHSKPTRGNSQKQKVIKNWVQTEKPFKISDMVKGLFDSIFGSSSGSKPKTPPRGTSTHTEKVQSSSPPKAKAAKEVGIKNWVQTEKPFKISDFVADVVGSVLPGGAPSPTPSGGRKEEKQTKVTEDATANDNREEEEAKDDDDSMAEKVVIVNWVQTEKPFKISDFIVSLFSTGASTTETVASNPSEDHADTEEDKAKEHEETSETANDENSNEESSQTDESSKNEEISHETDDSSSDVPVKNWKQTVKPFKFSELIGNMFNALFH